MADQAATSLKSRLVDAGIDPDAIAVEVHADVRYVGQATELSLAAEQRLDGAELARLEAEFHRAHESHLWPRWIWTGRTGSDPHHCIGEAARDVDRPRRGVPNTAGHAGRRSSAGERSLRPASAVATSSNAHLARSWSTKSTPRRWFPPAGRRSVMSRQMSSWSACHESARGGAAVRSPAR